MNFLHLKYLIEVEKYESISKAAQHLYINQPRLSKIIKEIEEEANIKIFERHNKGVVPTTKGREFLSQAKKIVQEVDYLKNMYQDDPHKLNLDICVPRSSYISEAFIEYLKMDNNMKKKLINSVILLIIAGILFFVVSKWASSVDSYTKILDTLNEMQKKALALTGASTALATGAAAIPGDATTPLANKLMDMAGYMVIVYAVIIIEKLSANTYRLFSFQKF